MAEHDKPRIDSVTGMSTTGHSWDGIEELNYPLPRWWLYLFYITIVWAVGYWVVYPSWPMVENYSKGVLGWHSRTAVEEELQGLKTLREKDTLKLAGTPLDQVITDYQNGKNEDVYKFAVAMGKAAFADNCAPCHGSGGQGSVGYPNLNDDVWLWGGTPEEIYTTIRHGVRSTSPNTHMGTMTAFGKDGMLTPEQISNVADFVRTQNGLPAGPKANLDAGKQVFAENCVVCHGEQGQGMKEMGTPNLLPLMVNGKPAPKVWLYKSDKEDIVHALQNGLGNVMPTWEGRLDDTTIKALAVYVVNLSGTGVMKK